MDTIAVGALSGDIPNHCVGGVLAGVFRCTVVTCTGPASASDGAFCHRWGVRDFKSRCGDGGNVFFRFGRRYGVSGRSGSLF